MRKHIAPVANGSQPWGKTSTYRGKQRDGKNLHLDIVITLLH